MAGLGLIGTAISAVGSILGGVAQSNQLEYQAEVEEVRANEARAVSQREAEKKDREAKYIISKQRAVAAASGGASDDPSVVRLMQDVAAEGDYQSRSALYEGETRGRFMEAQAKLNRMQARQAMFSGFIDAGSSVISGLSGFDKYKTPTYAGPYAYG